MFSSVSSGHSIIALPVRRAASRYSVPDRTLEGLPILPLLSDKFVAKYQKSRDARNPKTGENIKVPARFSVKFSPSSILKNAVAK